MGLFGSSKIVLNLEKTNYSPEENIKGSIKLALKKPIKGRGLEVALIGAEIRTHKSHNHNHFHRDDHHFGHHFDNDETYTTAQPFFLSKITLDGEKEYFSEEYEFEIKIPPDVHKDEPKYEGNLGKLMKFSQRMGGRPSYIEWYVKAQLDVPLKIDLRAEEKIKLA